MGLEDTSNGDGGPMCAQLCESGWVAARAATGLLLLLTANGWAAPWPPQALRAIAVGGRRVDAYGGGRR